MNKSFVKKNRTPEKNKYLQSISRQNRCGNTYKRLMVMKINADAKSPFLICAKSVFLTFGGKYEAVEA